MLGSEKSLPVRSLLERRGVVLSAAAIALVGLFIATCLSGSRATELFALFAIPVGLIALELGQGPGAAAAMAASALASIAYAVAATPAASRLLALTIGLLALALICGRFSERMSEARRQQRKLLNVGLELASRAQRSAIPGLLARSALEIVPARGVRVSIDGVAPAEVGAIDGDRLELALRIGAERLGTLVLAYPPGRSFTPNEVLALELLAVQAAVAAANEERLALETAQDALSSKLTAAQDSLADQGRRLGILLDIQEAERTVLAHELHEQAAQALAAIALELRTVQRDVRSEQTRAHVEDLRRRLAETLQLLRTLAVELRPPALDALGLEPALRSVARRASLSSGHEILIEVESIVDRLPAPLETTVYRLVDDIAGALRGPSAIRVRLDEDSGRLRIEATSNAVGSLLSPELQARIRPRLDLSAGTLSEERDVLIASIPVATS